MPSTDPSTDDLPSDDPLPDPLVAWSDRLIQSDRAALRPIFEALHAPLVRYATPLAGDTAAAQDIVQEAFVRLWQRRASLTPGRSVKPYLYTIVRNLALNERRNRTTRSDLLHQAAEPPAPARPPDRVDADALQHRLRRWIDDLPGRQREALLLSRYEGLSHDDIAQVMGVSPRTVNNHIVRALRTLRDRLQAFDPGLLTSTTSS